MLGHKKKQNGQIGQIGQISYYTLQYPDGNWQIENARNSTNDLIRFDCLVLYQGGKTGHVPVTQVKEMQGLEPKQNSFLFRDQRCSHHLQIETSYRLWMGDGCVSRTNAQRLTSYWVSQPPVKRAAFSGGRYFHRQPFILQPSQTNSGGLQIPPISQIFMVHQCQPQSSHDSRAIFPPRMAIWRQKNHGFSSVPWHKWQAPLPRRLATPPASALCRCGRWSAPGETTGRLGK